VLLAFKVFLKGSFFSFDILQPLQRVLLIVLPFNNLIRLLL